MQNSNQNIIFSNKYKMEADENRVMYLIDEIEPGFYTHFE